MAPPQHLDSEDVVSSFWTKVLSILRDCRSVDTEGLQPERFKLPPEGLLELATSLEASTPPYPQEAEAIHRIHEKVVESSNFGGLGLDHGSSLTQQDYKEIQFLVEAWLESLNASDRASAVQGPQLAMTRSSKVQPMTLAQKIFAQHTVGGCDEDGLQLGDVVRTHIDWILASELSWESMARTHESMSSPGIWRNDRFWLAGDHVVHPAVRNHPKIQSMVTTAEKAKHQFKMTEYQGMNYTIMHTEFVRERAEPGMLVIGSDSHTCSAGAVGCLAIGLGTADAMMALSLGETWFKCPESIRITFVGEPDPGMSGKDVILHILKKLKRNTVAAERIVEFSGPGVQHLSVDARFAICNMCTEFGAITGVFEPDGVTKAYIDARKRKQYRSNSVYFRADDNAVYAGQYTIDLSEVQASVARYPKPDDVVSVSEMTGLKLDGVFIGACTTTEEELVLASLVLKAGLKQGLSLEKGKRHYVPGSLPIVEKLTKIGVTDIYEAAGFTRGPPGCSYCVGLSAEKAAEGETWLSSQNRNFENRMGKGAFGHVSSAVVCAASAFDMTVTDPASLLKDIDIEFFNNYRKKSVELPQIQFVEPGLGKIATTPSPAEPKSAPETSTPKPLGRMTSRVVVLGDNIDTDALAPGSTLTTCTTDEEFGQHVLEHTHPDFRQKVRDGQRVVVAGTGMGIGSSREMAVSALKGAGVQAVIAKKFAFIYGRNQSSLGLLGFTIDDGEFYDIAREGVEITIDVPARMVEVGDRRFTFRLSDIEYNLTTNRGIAESFNRFGKEIWTQMARKPDETKHEADVLEAASQMDRDIDSVRAKMEW